MVFLTRGMTEYRSTVGGAWGRSCLYGLPRRVFTAGRREVCRLRPKEVVVTVVMIAFDHGWLVHFLPRRPLRSCDGGRW